MNSKGEKKTTLTAIDLVCILFCNRHIANLIVC